MEPPPHRHNAGRIARYAALPLLCVAPLAFALDTAIDGVEGEVKANIEAYLQNIEATEYTPERLASEIKRRSGEAMRVYGYYEPDISVTVDTKGTPAQPKDRPGQQDDKKPGGKKSVRIKVAPGEQVRIETLAIHLEGDARNDPPFRRAVEAFPLAQGDPLRHAPWDTLSSRLSAKALERGYFDWRFAQQRMEVRPYRQSARLYLDFDSGPRYRFGEVVISGSHIQPDRLEAIRTFAPGEPYLARSIAEYNQRLAETGWFGSVTVRPRLDSAQELAITPASQGQSWWHQATGSTAAKTQQLARSALGSAMQLHRRRNTRLPIDAVVTPAKRHQFEAGVGYATDVGPRLRFSWDQPWINRYGHSLNHDLYLSGPEQRFSGVYEVPLANPLRDSYRLQYGIKNRDDGDTNSLEGTVELARRWQFDNDWVQSVYLRTTYEDFTQGGESEKVLIYYPGIQWTRTRTREQRFPVWGDRQQLSLEYSDTAWGSDAQFFRLTGDTQWIRTLGEKNRFVGGLGVGAIETDDFAMIPPSLRFFAGGDNSVRGYSYESLAPRNDKGKLRGGQQMVTASAEYQRNVTGNWWGAAFVDTGDAFDSWAPDDLKTGAGLGVRWVSPVGPVRFDVAHPFDDDDDSWRIHFSIGPEF
ncbi:autotransporter assembly complex family protein [Halomonas cibimaris]|uniref:Translocation and assembly module subunit TamA n=1 Tax=Halomonas cibimaris TaxID=657012 RepID=A0ABP7LWD5_9GAMM